MTKLRNKLKYATLTMLASTAISAKVDAKSDENTSSEKFSKVEHGVIGNTTIEKIFTSFSDDRIYKEYDYFKSTKDLGNGYSVVSTESNISENSENKVNSSLYLVGKDGSVVDISGINNFDDELHKARHNPKKENLIITKAICTHCQNLNQEQKDAIRLYMQNSTKVLNEPIYGTFHSYTQSQVIDYARTSTRW